MNDPSSKQTESSSDITESVAKADKSKSNSMESKEKHHHSESKCSEARRLPSKLPELPNLVFGNQIGEGHFSQVWRGTYKNQDVAIKVIERGSERAVADEVYILKQLRGLPNIIQIRRVFTSSCENTILVFSYHESIPRQELLGKLNIQSLRTVLQNLLIALQAAHALTIAHRDVKLSNIMIAPDFSICLIDWGCACILSEEERHFTRAGARLCRSPEMLLGYHKYDCRCDIWATGIFLLYLLSCGRIPWGSESSCQTLLDLLPFYGFNTVLELKTKFGDDFRYPQGFDEMIDSITDFTPSKTIPSLFSKNLKRLTHPLLTDLILKMLAFDPDNRPTATQCLEHPFFTIQLDLDQSI